MEYSQVATLLNDTEIPNLLGEDVTIADDLNNIVDIGVAMENLTADQIKDYTGSFVAGIVRVWLDERVFSKTINNLYRDYYEFGAIVQRVKSGLMEVTDDVSTNLENGTVYQQDKFIGFNFDNKVYTKQAGFELDWSIPNNMWKVAFSSPVELMKLIAYIGNRAEATVRANIFALQLATVRKMAVTHAASRIKLVTLYNSIFNAGEGDTPITAAQAETDASFLRWACEQIVLVKKALTDISAKANDGTITTYTPAEDIDVIMLSKFATDIKFNMTSDVYNKELVDIGNYEELNFFQNSGTSITPDIAVSGEILESVPSSVEGGDPTVTHIEKCVAIVYDKYAAGITSHGEKVTAHYNAKGDFTNYFRRCPATYYVDSRENTVVFTLE